MTADRWQRLNDIFHEALALGPADRPAYLRQASAGDESLRREAEELLEAHRRAEAEPGTIERLELSLDQMASAAAMEGRRIGPYRVAVEIGRGGMGTVWLADRADGQFEQRVAIKLIKRGMDTAQILDRFRAERQILASLDHPGIARLLDGGTTDDGLPYFVMEYIDGQPIDQYAAERRLSVRARLELFLLVCDAVSHAHRHLIVHRDIKPQNILITGAGVPKLLDFGIAKVLQEAGDQGTLTVSGPQLLTPDYASPEQVEGRQTTTQTDVYSLGVVLYELLTGRSPYRPRTWTTPDVFESVRSSEIVRPSAAVSRPVDGTTRRRPATAADGAAATGAASLDRLQTELRGDLDAIVLSALRKEPDRRYGSVEQLAADIRRHLNGLPVRARTDSLWYRGMKFARRNRVGVTAAGLIALTLIGGTLTTAWQARNARIQARLARDAQARAEQRFAEVRRLANVLLFDYHDAIKDLPGSTPVRERLVRDALEYLNRLAAEGGGDASLQRELALAYRRVADVQGGFGGASLGDTTGAIESHRRSLAILEAILAARPDDPQARSDVAEGALQLASLAAVTDDQAEALALARRAGSLYEPLGSASAPALDERLALANAYDVIGVISLESGKPAEALENHRRQLHLLQSAPAPDQANPRLRRALSVAHHHMADAQGTFGDLPAALESIRRSLEIRAALAAESPNNTDYRSLLAVSHYWEGDTLARLGRVRHALEAYRRSLAIGEALAAADPAGHRVTFTVVRVGNMLARLGEHEQALQYYRRAEAIAVDDVRTDPANLWDRAGLIEIQAHTCAALVRLARPIAASRCAETAGLIEKTTVEPTNAVVRAALARSYTAMADAHAEVAAAGRSPAARRLTHGRTARDLYQKSVTIWSDMAARGMLTASDDEEAAAVARALAESESVLRRLGAA